MDDYHIGAEEPSQSKTNRKVEKDVNKCITNVQLLLHDTLIKSQKERFNIMYGSMLKKIEQDKHVNKHPSKHVLPSSKKHSNDNIGILEYDFLNPVQKKSKKNVTYSSIYKTQSPKRTFSDKSYNSPNNSLKRMGNGPSEPFTLILNSPVKEKEREKAFNHQGKFTNKNKVKFQSNENKINDKSDESVSKSPTSREISDDFDDNLENKDIYTRNLIQKRHTQKILEIKRKEKLQKESEALKAKPEISKVSKRIIKEKLNNEKPLYERYQEVIGIQQQKLNTLKKIADHNEATKTQKIKVKREFNPNKSVSYDPVKFDEWLNDEKRWVKKIEDKVIQMKQYYKDIENEDIEFTFIPSINKFSDKICKYRSLEKCVLERLHNDHMNKMIKRNMMIDKSIPSFKPTLNNRIPCYIRTTPINNSLVIEESKILSLNILDLNNSLGLVIEESNKNVIHSEIKGNLKHESELQSIQQLKQLIQSSNSNELQHSLKEKKSFARSYSTENPNENNEYQSNNNDKNKTINSQIKNKYQKMENQEKNKEDLRINNKLYRINIQDSSIWDRNKENNIIYDPSLDFVFHSENKVKLHKK